MQEIQKELSSLFIVSILVTERDIAAAIELLRYLPATTGMSFVLLQNYTVDCNNQFIEQIQETANMPVVVADADSILLKTNEIYVSATNNTFDISATMIRLSEYSGPEAFNSYFSAVSDFYRERCVGIFYTYNVSNAGKCIKQKGGIVVCLNAKSEQSDTQVKSHRLLDVSLIDYEIIPKRIEELLIKLSNDNSLMSKTHLGIGYYNKILHEVFKVSGIDFKKYKRNTIIRRLEKRMNQHKISTLSDYLNFILDNDIEKEELKQDFLIRVSSFFRNPEAFKSLKLNVIPAIVNSKEDSETVRVWVPGCSTGEEVYTLAMLFDDYIETNNICIDFKLFASDVDTEALMIARKGSYDLELCNNIDSYYVDKYFDKIGDNIQITSRIRKKIVFLNHNLLKDSPFIRLDLISCRNLLIYIDSEMQRRILLNFQFALNHNGFLFLGNSETLGDTKRYFSSVDSKCKLYQSCSKTKVAPLQSHLYISSKITTNKSRIEALVRTRINHKEKTDDIFHRYLSKKYSPDCIFFDQNFNVLYLKGDAGKRLCLLEGVFQNNLLNMVSVSIATIIRSSVRKLNDENRDIVIKNVSNIINGEEVVFDLIFHKSVENDLQEVYLLEFSAEQSVKTDRVEVYNVPIDDISAQRINDLENELKESRVQLQDTVEELETSNEELQSSNEELMASIEELRTINEEFQFVNDELVGKNKELEKLNNDVNNLLTSTAITTLFVDVEFKIRKFTPSIKRLFNIQEENINQPLSSFSSNFSEQIRTEIINDLKVVLDCATVIEKEITDVQGNIYIRRISPFITSEKRIDGCVITFIDITTLKQTEQILSKTTELYQLATEATNVGVWEWSIKDDRWTGNSRWKEVLGVGDDVVFEGIYLNMDDRDVEGCKIYLQDHLTKKTDLFFCEFRYHHPKTDKTYWLSIKGKVIERDLQEEPTKMIGVVLDITKQKTIIEQLEAQKYFSQRLSEASPSGIYVHHIKSGQKSFMNAQYETLLGYAKEEFNILNSAQRMALIHPDDRPLYSEHILAVISGEEQVSVEARFKNKNGEWIWCLSIDSPFDRNKKGEVTSYIGVLLDITEQKKREGRLVRYKKAIESATDAIEIITLGGEHSYQNAAFSTLFGYHYKETKGRKIEDFFNDKLQANEILRAVCDSDSWSGETVIVTKTGEVIDVHLRADTIKNKKEVALGYVFSYTDITERKKVEVTLINAAAVAEKASVQKNYFLANMSHEIRTPINGIVGFADLLKNDQISPDARHKYLDIIDSNSKQLLALINDILDVAKIEAGELSITTGECRINHMLQNLEANFNQLAATKNGGDIRFVLDEPLGQILDVIKVDCLRLRQVLVNLLSNAQKFTEQGEIHFGYQVKGSMIEFYVADKGIGISKDKLNEIFLRFKQATCDISAVYGGSGLGLAISKGIVSLLGGSISVESEVDKGSTFSFTIPLIMMEELKKSKEIFKKSMEGQKLKEKTVLIADDDISVQTYLEAVLEPYNVNIIMANNGEEAVELFKTTPGIDLVLLDIRMPVMNGFTALGEILHFDSSAIVIVQSAYVMLDEREQCLSMGCKEYLEKPLDRYLLVDTLEKWIN